MGWESLAGVSRAIRKLLAEVSLSEEENMNTLNSTQVCPLSHPEAGNAYFVAAKLADSYTDEFEEAFKRYNQAAKCFSKIKSNHIIVCYIYAVNVYLKNGEINRAIQFCVLYGYKCNIDLGDTSKSDVFYNKADELRYSHQLSHTCVMTKWEPSPSTMTFAHAMKERSKVSENND
ncbi:hypothetical protein RF11_05920 [Thelohanellus kitauei]|uniref:Uncharacterized protein n=1 Tax=Thelohanellus kitauei TaxID=669202 RepID=A0A0C2MRE6_THEKT|nr:hypothetical protein RF11_05920 [Thelohanellus kitauei]